MEVAEVMGLMARAREVEPARLEAFVRGCTTEGAASLVPELRLGLASEALPLWREVGRFLAQAEGPLPYWAFAWAGGQALARYLLDEPRWVEGKAVLDLASGSGLVGLAARKAGASRVLCADIDPLAAVAARLNAERNGLEVEVTDEDVIGRPLEGFEVVVAGDVCYDAGLAARSMAWFEGLAARGVLVLVGDPGRNYLPREGLTPVAEYRVPTTRELEDAEVRRTRVFRVG
jgi:predicted nicotinamide N-methyase